MMLMLGSTTGSTTMNKQNWCRACKPIMNKKYLVIGVGMLVLSAIFLPGGVPHPSSTAFLFLTSRSLRGSGASLVSYYWKRQGQAPKVLYTVFAGQKIVSSFKHPIG
jgi:hypothetical protein